MLETLLNIECVEYKILLSVTESLMRLVIQPNILEHRTFFFLNAFKLENFKKWFLNS